MEGRAALTAEIDAIPLGQSIDEVFQRRWAVEESVLSCKATTIDELKAQLKILAARAADGADVADDLARLV